MCLKKHKLIFVTGVPGSGKSYRIQHDLKLMDLPRVDIRNIYETRINEVALGSWMTAQDMMLDFGKQLIDQNKSDVICEAILLPGTPSRERLKDELKRRKLKAQFIDLKETYEVCLKRVQQDYKDQLDKAGIGEQGKIQNYFFKRVDILNSYRSKGLI